MSKHAKALGLALALVLPIAGVIFYLTWNSYSGAVWMDSKHNLQYAWVGRANYDVFEGGVFAPCYDAKGQRNDAVWVNNGEITVNGNRIDFPTGKRFAVVGQDGEVQFVECPESCFQPQDGMPLTIPDPESLVKTEVWKSTIQSALGTRPQKTQ